MPKFVKIETENNGEFFQKCATEIVAGRNASSKTFGDDYIRVLHFEWHAMSNYNSDTSITAHLTVTAHPPAVVSALNVLNNRDKIKKMILNNVDSVSSPTGNNRGVITGIFTAEDGTLISANESNGDEKGVSKLSLVIEFTSFSFDNRVTNTLGTIKTVNAGV